MRTTLLAAVTAADRLISKDDLKFLIMLTITILSALYDHISKKGDKK